MRGDDQQQNHIFSYLSPEARVRKDHLLRGIFTFACAAYNLVRIRNLAATVPAV